MSAGSLYLLEAEWAQLYNKNKNKNKNKMLAAKQGQGEFYTVI